MRIGVPKEIKVHEYRVGLVPAAVRELVDAGHEVWCRPAPPPASALPMRTTSGSARRSPRPQPRSSPPAT